MALDGIYIRHVKNEIEAKLIGGRVDKIYQPNRDELLFSFRTKEENLKLLISARPNTARVHFTEVAVENPKQPPMLCMLLRKKLLSAKLLSVRQNGLERALLFDFDSVNELGDHVTLTLAVEIMGKYSNIIFVNEDGKIIDALKRVDAEMSSERLIFPGLIYRDPPAQDKLCILEATIEEIYSRIISVPKPMPLSKALMSVLQGISPVISREIEHIASRGREISTADMTSYDITRLKNALGVLKETAADISGKPVTVLDLNRKPIDFAFMEINQYGSGAQTREEESFSKLLDRFYAERDRIERMRVRSADILKILSNRSDRLSRKINNQKAELDECDKKDDLRIKADLINANLYAIPKGASEADLQNFYEEGSPMLKVRLNPSHTPSQNAQRYYKDYRKAKTAEIKLNEQIKLGMEELEYVDSVFYALTEAESEQDLDEIRTELAEQGYIKAQYKKGKPNAAGKPLKFMTEDGFTVLVGRNNKQNDKLTLKDANNNDYWFHTKNIHGSHVILVTEGREPSAEAMTFAAALAAKHSKAKDSAQVPVDYTKVRHVSKPQGSKPGMVLYVNYKTIFVDPNL